MKMTDIYHYYQLLEVFSIREIKSRYKASILGFLWIIIYPLISAIILFFVFGIVIKIPSGDIPYFLFLLSGLSFWTYFQQSVNLAKDSLVWNRDLVINNSFPKDTIPLSYCLSKVPDFFVNLGIFTIFYFIIFQRLDFGVMVMALMLLPIFLFTAGISLVISLLNAVFRDFGRIVELCMMVIFYVTPIIYSENLIPDGYKFLLNLNPISLSIISTRSFIFEHYFRMDLFCLSLFISVLVFVAGVLFFKKFEKLMIDMI